MHTVVELCFSAWYDESAQWPELKKLNKYFVILNLFFY